MFAEQRFCKSLFVLLWNELVHLIPLYKVVMRYKHRWYSNDKERGHITCYHNEQEEDGMGDWNNQELNLRGRTKLSVKGHKIKEG